MKFSFLLKMLDKYPFTVRRRGKAPMPFLARKVTITTCMTPDQLYTNLHASDKLGQLYRRCSVIVHEREEKKEKEKVHKTI